MGRPKGSKNKKKEVEDVVSPLMSKLYQDAGGGMPGGMPEGCGPDGCPMPESEPTIDAVD